MPGIVAASPLIGLDAQEGDDRPCPDPTADLVVKITRTRVA